jgi:hypothetical protein
MHVRRWIAASVVAATIATASATLVPASASQPPPSVVTPTAPAHGTGFRARLDAYRLLKDANFADPKVADALRKFADALTSVTGDGIRKDTAFQADSAGISSLVQSATAPATVRAASGFIAQADGIAARVQFDLAAVRRADIAPAVPSAVDNYLQQALSFIQSGDANATAGKFKQAVDDYRSAWIAASKALSDIAASADADHDLLDADIEAGLGLNPNSADSDGDRLADIEELWTTFTDPANPRTDGVTPDADADPDADGLGHFRELAAGSDPLVADTDGDGLLDGAEVDQYGTSPALADTDTDGLDDDSELRLGTDPLDPDSNDNGVLDGDEIYETETTFTDLGIGVTVTGVGDIAPTIKLANESEADWLNNLPGLASPVVNLTTERPFQSAALTIPFDPSAVPNGDFGGLGIMYFDEVAGTWRPLPAATTSVNPLTGTVTAETTHFTLFAVFYIPNWQAVLDAFDPNPGSGGGGGETTQIDVALVLDSSGSMTTNDPLGLRRTAAKRFIDALIPGDQVAVVDFDSFARLFQPLTTDFAAAKAAVDRIDSSGGTNIGAGVSVANNELINNGNPDHARVMILLTDGEGSYNPALTQQAIDNHITIYTIGLGSFVDAALLAQIATATGGQYFAVASADQLPDVFSRIPVNLEPAGDEDKDGLKNGIEMRGAITGSGATYVLDPLDPDTDGDGLMDGDEIYLGDFSVLYAFVVASNPRSIDSDNDGLTDADEQEVSLNPLGSDWDGDGLKDGVEIFAGFDPRSSNIDDDPFGDAEELAQGSDPFSYDLDGADQVRAFVAGALLGEFGPNVPAFDTSLKDLAGDLVELAPDIPYVSDALQGIADGVSGALVGIGCGANDLLGWVNPFGGGPADAVCDILNFRIKYDPAYAKSLSYLGGWIVVSLIPFVDIVASVRDLVGALINGDWIGAGLEAIFGVIGFFAPVAGDVPGIAGKILKFVARAPEAVGAVFKFVVKRFGDKVDEVLLPLIRQVWNVSDNQIDRVGGTARFFDLSDEYVNTGKLGAWLSQNSLNKISRATVDSDEVLEAVQRSWDEAGQGAAERTVRNLAAEAVSTEAVVKALEARGADLLYVSRNVPLDVGDDIRRSVVNGPDIIARGPSGRPLIVEVKGSNADKLSIGRSTITNSAGTQTSRAWLADASGTRYRNTLAAAAAVDDTGRLDDALAAIDEILAGGDYDVIIAGASRDTVFRGTLEDALLGLNNGGASEVLEIDVPGSLLDDAYNALSP